MSPRDIYNVSGSGNIGRQQNNYHSAENSETATLEQVAKILREHRSALALDPATAGELDRSTAVLDDAVQHRTPRAPEVATAGRFIGRTTGQLIIGAGGNALWEAFKALVGL